MSKVEDRLVELETKLAFMEQANQELSDEIYAQHQRFELRLNAIEQRFERLEKEQDQGINTQEEKPPHY